jgi:Protein of unknown function (DUF2785)
MSGERAHRARWLTSVFALAIAAAAPIARAGETPAAHDAAFWQAIVDADYRVPPGQSAVGLVDELIGLLGNSDPVLRDRYRYEIFAACVYRDQLLAPAELEGVHGRLCADARAGLGSPPDDRTLRRSFSLLDLSVLAAYDLRAPFMSQSAFEATLAVGIDSLAGERDLRGFEPGKGWVHATAHAADLLKFLARNPKLARDDQGKLVSALRDRLESAGQVFVWSEDARLAAALLSLLRRPDVDPDLLQPWLKSLVEAQERLWSGELDPAAYAVVRAQVNTLTQLAAMLGREPDDKLAIWEREIQATLARTAL